MGTRTAALVLAILLAAAAKAAAQPSPSSAQLLPDLPRFDLSAGLGWFNGTFEGVPDGRRWYNDAGWWGAQFGYYWTENLKLEAEVSGSGEGRGWSTEEGRSASGRPFYRYREHGLTARTLSGGLLYQFGHNQFLHPFVGAGLDVDFTRNLARTTGFYLDDPRGQEPLPAMPDETIEETRAGAFGLVGLKAYLGERAFFRGDLKLGTSGPERKIVGRALIGVDF